MPSEIRMVYVESCEYVTPAPEYQTVAHYDMFGFHRIPGGGFEPDNNDHVGELGCWDWQASSDCAFPDIPFDACDWLQLLETAVRDSSVVVLLRRRETILLFADHDGPVSVVR